MLDYKGCGSMACMYIHWYILQQACGFEYTSKLQRMFQDMSLSKDLNERFKAHISSSGDPLEGKSVLVDKVVILSVACCALWLQYCPERAVLKRFSFQSYIYTYTVCCAQNTDSDHPKISRTLGKEILRWPESVLCA